MNLNVVSTEAKRTIFVLVSGEFARLQMTKSLAVLPKISVQTLSGFEEFTQILEGQVFPDMMVMDASYPDITVDQVYHELETRGIIIPFLCLASGPEGFEHYIEEHPFFELVQKPISADGLSQRIQSHLETDWEQHSSPFSVTEYLQMSNFGRHSVKVETYHDGRVSGWVILLHGDPWTAQDDKGTGFGALQRILQSRPEFVSCTPLEVGNYGNQTLFGAIEHLLLESCRLQDEGSESAFESMEFDTVQDDQKTPSFASLELDLVAANDSQEFELPQEPAHPQSREQLHTPAPHELPFFPKKSLFQEELPEEFAYDDLEEIIDTPAHLPEASPSDLITKGDDDESFHLLPRTPTLSYPSPIPLKVKRAPTPQPPQYSKYNLEFEELYEQGVDALLYRDYARALKVFKKAEKISPENKAIRANLRRLEELGYSG